MAKEKVETKKEETMKLLDLSRGKVVIIEAGKGINIEVQKFIKWDKNKDKTIEKAYLTVTINDEEVKKGKFIIGAKGNVWAGQEIKERTLQDESTITL